MLDPSALGVAATQGPGCLDMIVVMVDVSHTSYKSGHDDTKSGSKIDGIPSDKGEALLTKIRLPRKGVNPFCLVKLTSPKSCG